MFILSAMLLTWASASALALVGSLVILVDRLR
jgi:hypothetical protein